MSLPAFVTLHNCISKATITFLLIVCDVQQILYFWMQIVWFVENNLEMLKCDLRQGESLLRGLWSRKYAHNFLIHSQSSLWERNELKMSNIWREILKRKITFTSSQKFYKKCGTKWTKFSRLPLLFLAKMLARSETRSCIRRQIKTRCLL